MHKNKKTYPRHVVFLLSTLLVGGSERKTVRIANELSNKGMKLTIAYLNGPHTLKDEISDDVNVLFLDRKGKIGFGALRKLAAYVTKHDVDLICSINLYPLIYSFISRLILVKSSFKLIATTNETKFVRRADDIKMALYAPMLRRVDRIIFGNVYQMGLWIQKYKLNERECVHIYNGVDINRFHQSEKMNPSQSIREKLGIPDTGIIIGSIGRFRKEKHYQTVIQACIELRKKSGLDVYCLLVGGGFEEQQLKDLVAETDSDAYVYLLDAKEDIYPYLEAMDVFVLSSISETFSNSALEAMAMSLPVVLPRVGGCPEMVKQGISGFIYEPGNISQFVEYLLLLCADEERRLKMGRAAREYVETDFKFESMVESYVNLFEKVI